jgi:hypothetical protein
MLLASPHFCFRCHRRENRDLAMRILDLFSGLERGTWDNQSSANISLWRDLLHLLLLWSSWRALTCFLLSANLLSAITEERFWGSMEFVSHGLETRDAWHCPKKKKTFTMLWSIVIMFCNKLPLLLRSSSALTCFASSILFQWCCQSGNHQENNLAKFGHILDMKVGNKIK